MSDHSPAGQPLRAGLVQIWVSVTDRQGRTRLEARWADASAPRSSVTHAA